jgi:hypothetical protein
MSTQASHSNQAPAKSADEAPTATIATRGAAATRVNEAGLNDYVCVATEAKSAAKFEVGAPSVARCRTAATALGEPVAYEHASTRAELICAKRRCEESKRA